MLQNTIINVKRKVTIPVYTEKPPIDESARQEERPGNSGFSPELYEMSGHGQISAHIR